MIKKLILLWILIAVSTTVVFAGGGRFNLYTSSSDTYHIKEAYILAQVYKVSISSDFSVGERVEFRIRNPQDGDKCLTELSVTDSNGFTRGKCTASGKREMEVYLASLDNGDESGSYMLYFIDPPKPSPTVKPTVKPTVIPTKIPTPTVITTPQKNVPEITIDPSKDAGIPEPENKTLNRISILLLTLFRIFFK